MNHAAAFAILDGSISAAPDIGDKMIVRCLATLLTGRLWQSTIFVYSC
jgi:hypothetical protein